MTRAVYVHGAAALGPWGFEWRSLGAVVQAGAAIAGAVPAVSPAIDVEPRSLKLMSHAARLSAVALRLALADAAWPQAVRGEAAFYMGVGASGGAVNELTAMLGASIEAHEYSLARFGGAGLAACNPLFAFQLMNNFTLCHGAIQCGVGGPNGAFYSRGTGTVAALSEAHWALASGACDHALAGGADTALHPVTWAALCRDGHAALGLVPSEGAALLALGAAAQGALARLVQVEFHSAQAWQHDAALLHRLPACDLLVIAPWGEPARTQLRAAVAGPWIDMPCVDMPCIDISVTLGEALAATPALAWAAALAMLQPGQRALVLTAGIDGGLGLVVLEALP